MVQHICATGENDEGKKCNMGLWGGGGGGEVATTSDNGWSGVM